MEEGEGDYFLLELARDGSSVAYVEELTSVWLLNVVRGTRSKLTFEETDHYSPTWSPDSSQIAFTSRRDGVEEIYVMNSDGSSQTRLTDGSGLGYSRLAWSPDGSKIGFMSNREGNWEIFTMNSDGTSQLNISSNSAWDGQLDWGP